MYPVQQPDFYLGKAGEKFHEAGELTDTATKKLINTVWDEFVRLIGKLK
jgi:hypothetical protein